MHRLIGLECKLCKYTIIIYIYIYKKEDTDKDCDSILDRPIHLSGRVPHDTTKQHSFKSKIMAMSPSWGLDAKTDSPTDHQ